MCAVSSEEHRLVSIRVARYGPTPFLLVCMFKPLRDKFDSCKLLDPTPLRTLVHDITLSRSLSHPKHPPKSQHAPLSSLQRLVKDARSSILEPLGLGLGADVGSTAPSEIGIDFDDSAGGPMITGPDGTGADVRGGKKRGGLRVVIPAHPQLRARGANGAFLTATATPTSTGRNSPTAIRNGSTYSRPKRTGISSTVGSPATTTAFLVPSPTTPFYPPPTPERPGLGLSMAALPRVMPKPKPKSKALRPRKGAVVSSTPSTTSRTRGRHAAAEPMEVDNSDTTCAPARAPVVQITPSIKIMLGKRTRAASPSPPPTAEMPLPAHVGGSAGKGNGKKKPETYKQAWSVSEQHLLEKLLDEIPEGSKNR